MRRGVVQRAVGHSSGGDTPEADMVIADGAADDDTRREHAGVGLWLRYGRSVERFPEVASITIAALILGVLSLGQYGLGRMWSSGGGSSVAPHSSMAPPFAASDLYHSKVFDVHVGTRMCQHHTDTLMRLAAKANLVPFLLPTTNETHGVRTRCFVDGHDASSYACERDLLGFVLPVWSQELIADRRSGKPLSAAADWVRIDDSGDISLDAAAPSTPRLRAQDTRSLTSMPDYLATREFLERHRFWRTAGREGLRELERPKVFLDIGPNGGYHTVVASMYGFEVIAFEPVPIAAAALQEAMCLHDYLSNKVTVANFTPGLRDEECMTSSRSRGGHGHSGGELNASCYSTFSIPEAAYRGVRVRHRPIDQLNIPFVSVVKIDAGYRTLSVLMSLQRTIAEGGYEDPSIVVSDRARGSPPSDTAAGDGAVAAAPLRRYPVTVVCVRVPLRLVPKAVDFLWSLGMIVAWRDIDRGVIENNAALQSVLERAKQRADGGAAGLHLFARPRERVDTPDHIASLKSTAKAVAGGTTAEDNLGH